MIPYNYFLLVTGAIFVVAIYGVLSRRNGITLIVSGELIINSALINIVAATESFNLYNGANYVLIILVVAVLESAAFISLLIALYKETGSSNLSKLREIKG